MRNECRKVDETAAWPAALQVALKEWDVVCRALADGRQMLLLRKGGIYEAAGEFELEHRRFLLFPTLVHQNPKMLKQSEQLETVAVEPSRICLSAAAEVTDIIPVSGRAAMDALDDQHVWGPPLIDMRFGYKPQNPLYLLLLRVYRLARLVTVDNTPEYAGCKSWVRLEQPVATDEALPVLDEARYQERRRLILNVLNGAACG
jgi:hypothetical protein